MKFAAIMRQTGSYPVRWMCQKLGVQPSGFYAWRQRETLPPTGHNAVLLAHVRATHVRSHQAYGSPGIYRELQALGIIAGRHRIARVMRENGISGQRKRRRVKTTDSKHRLPVAPDLLKRDFVATAPNQKWVTDMTYIQSFDRWLGFRLQTQRLT